jgi:hypothetical protein
MHRLRRLPQRPEPREQPSGPKSWGEIECLVASSVIGGILAVLLIGAFYFLLRVGVERFLEWPIGYLVARFLMGLLGLAVFGLGSKALFAVFTGGRIVASKPATVLASLFFVLIGLAFIVLAVVPWDSEGF